MGLTLATETQIFLSGRFLERVYFSPCTPPKQGIHRWYCPFSLSFCLENECGFFEAESNHLVNKK